MTMRTDHRPSAAHVWVETAPGNEAQALESLRHTMQGNFPHVAYEPGITDVSLCGRAFVVVSPRIPA